VLAWLCFPVECTQSAVMLPWYAKNDCNRIWHYMRGFPVAPLASFKCRLCLVVLCWPHVDVLAGQPLV